MPKFVIMTPVPDWTGAVGAAGTETHFVKGSAELDVVDVTSAGRLAYFRSAGYQIEAADDVTVDEAIRRVTMTPTQEHAELTRESKALDEAAELDKLRDEVARKRAAQTKADEAESQSDDKPAVEVAPARTAKGGQR